MNSINIIGRLTREMSLKKTPSGTSVISNAIAYNELRGGEEVSMFFDFVAYGKTAELIDKYFHKGDLIGLSGKLTQRYWPDKQMNKRSTIEISVSDITFMPNHRGQAKTEVSDPDFESFSKVDSTEGDLPF